MLVWVIHRAKQLEYQSHDMLNQKNSILPPPTKIDPLSHMFSVKSTPRFFEKFQISFIMSMFWTVNSNNE